MKINPNNELYSFNNFQLFQQKRDNTHLKMNVPKNQNSTPILDTTNKEIKSSILNIQETLKELQTSLSSLVQYQSILNEQGHINHSDQSKFFHNFPNKDFLNQLQETTGISSISKLLHDEIQNQESAILRKQIEMQNILAQYSNSDFDANSLEFLDDIFNVEWHLMSQNKIQNLLE